MSFLNWIKLLSKDDDAREQPRPRHEVSKLTFEPLEERRLLSATPIDAPSGSDIPVPEILHRDFQPIVEISQGEQYMVELINRARENPLLEAARHGIDVNDGLPSETISGAPISAIAPNQLLSNAALGHSQDMIERGYFNHFSPEGNGPVQRILGAGYQSPRNFGENIAWVGASGDVDLTQSIEQTHSNLFRSGRHRQDILNDAFREIGVGVQDGEFQNLNAVVTTQKFSRRPGDAFLTGVVYEDIVTDNDFYNIGEAFGGSTLTAINSYGEAFETRVGSSGGYALELPDGAYTVVLADSRLGESLVANAVVSDGNTKLDFEVSAHRVAADSDDPGDPVIPVDPNAPVPTESLSVTLSDDEVSEGDGPMAATGVVRRTGDLSSELVVELTSNDTSEITVPQTITIAAGEAESAPFEIAAEDDTVLDDTKRAGIIALADGYQGAAAVIDVTDNETEMTVLSPSGDILNSQPTIEWNAHEDAARYVLIVDSREKSNVIREMSLTEAKYSPPQGFDAGDYMVRVIALDENGRTLAEAEPVTFSVAAPPQLTSPEAYTNNAIPTVNWTGIDAATTYELRIDDIGNGTSDFIRQASLTGTSFTPDSPMPSGKYQVFVRGVDANGETGAWSAGLAFELDAAPTLHEINSPVLAAHPTVSWTGTVLAENYDLVVVDKKEGRPIIREAGLTGTSYEITAPLDAGEYEVWIRATEPDGPTPWGDPISFEIAARPQLAFPHGGDLSQTPTLQWQAPGGFKAFDIQVDNLTTGTTETIRTADANKTHTFTDALAGGRYRFMVRGVLGDDQPGAWSQPNFATINDPTLNTSQPTVLGPTGEFESQTPTFEWTSIQGASGYQIELRDLSNNVETTSGLLRHVENGNQSYQLASNIPPGEYEIRIRAFDHRLNAGDWSETASFTIIDPQADDDDTGDVGSVDPYTALDQFVSHHFDGHGLM